VAHIYLSTYICLVEDIYKISTLLSLYSISQTHVTQIFKFKFKMFVIILHEQAIDARLANKIYQKVDILFHINRK